MLPQKALHACEKISLKNHLYSINEDKILLLFKNCFSIISITANTDEDPIKPFILSNENCYIFDDFYEEDLIELGICTQEEINENCAQRIKHHKELQYAQYLALKKIFEPN